MDIHIAFRDTPDGTMVVGAFGAEAEAREACQEDADGNDAGPLTWPEGDTRSAELDDHTRYDVILCNVARRRR